MNNWRLPPYHRRFCRQETFLTPPPKALAVLDLENNFIYYHFGVTLCYSLRLGEPSPLRGSGQGVPLHPH